MQKDNNQVVHNRSGEENAVNAIQNTTMTGNNKSGVFDADLSFNERLGEITQGAEDASYDTQNDGFP